MGYGVTVTLQILVLSFLVRIQIAQQKRSRIMRPLLFFRHVFHRLPQTQIRFAHASVFFISLHIAASHYTQQFMEERQATIPLRRVMSLIPAGRRKGAIGVVAASAALALLDFIGVAVLVPILLLVLSIESTFSYPAMQWLYDTLGFHSFDSFTIAICVAVLAIIILKSTASLAITNSINRYLLSLYRYYSERMFDTYLSKGLLFIRNNNTSQLINNVNGVCLRFTEGTLGQVFAITTECILLLLVAAALLWYDPRLVLLAIAVFLPLTLVYALVFRRRMNRNGRMENRLMVGQNKMLYETLRGYSDIEINDAAAYVSGRFRHGLRELTDCRRKTILVYAAAGRMTEFSLILGVVAMITIGLLAGISMESLKVSLGVFAVAAYKIVPSVNRITSSCIEYKRNSFAAERIASELAGMTTASQVGRDDTDTGTRMPFMHDIRLDNISFGYEPDGRKVLEGFSLTISKGEKIGIKGSSGAGKTTLFNILCGFFAPDSGKVLIDGTTLTPANRKEWQRNLAYVSQDVFLPDISLAENIAFGKSREEIDPERLRAALHAASLTDFVDTLPHGADTVVGEAGCRLSGGQRQRIGIARALYKDASVLLFDEATSSLDSHTEHEIMDAIEELSHRRSELTILIISHRENTLGFCDRIIELGNK